MDEKHYVKTMATHEKLCRQKVDDDHTIKKNLFRMISMS